MFNEVFKDRSAKAAEQALADLLATRELREFTLSRNVEIGPFLIDYIFPACSIVVELIPLPESRERTRHESRVKFLSAMGFRVFAVSPAEVLRHPQQVLIRLRRALED